jgi:hypothetical protein
LSMTLLLPAESQPEHWQRDVVGNGENSGGHLSGLAASWPGSSTKAEGRASNREVWERSESEPTSGLERAEQANAGDVGLFVSHQRDISHEPRGRFVTQRRHGDSTAGALGDVGY